MAKPPTPKSSIATDRGKSISTMAAKKLRSVHLEDILRNDFLEPLGLTAYRLAKQLGVSPPTITQIVARRRGVTAEMALRLARYFGTSAQIWQNLQSQHEQIATTKIAKVVFRKVGHVRRSDRSGHRRQRNRAIRDSKSCEVYFMTY
jgi:antitoxin HigA-1